LFQDKLLQLALEVLRLFQGFIRGTSMAEDFADVPGSVATIMQWWPNLPGAFNEEDFNQWLTDTFQPVADEIQKVIDAIIQGFNAWFEQIGFTTDDVQDFSNTVGQALGTLGTLGLRLENLEKANAVVLEDFSTYPNNTSSLGPDWIQSYSGSGGGTLGIVNGFAVPTLALDTSNKRMNALWKNPVASDLKKISATISTPAEVFGQSENFIIGRADPNIGGDFVFAGLTWTRARIGYVTNGQVTQLRSVTHNFMNGSVYTFDLSDERSWRLYEGSKLVLEAVDAGGVSSFGVGYRSVGFSGFAPNGLARPGVVGSFACYLN
jgi:hypothetical protein